MNDIYRGFELNWNGSVWQIIENGKVVDDAATEEKAYDLIDAILRERLNARLASR